MGEVVDFSKFKKKESDSGRRLAPVVPLDKEPTKKTIHRDKQGDSDVSLAERIERIKSSIVRINQLMAELRAMGNQPKKD